MARLTLSDVSSPDVAVAKPFLPLPVRQFEPLRCGLLSRVRTWWTSIATSSQALKAYQNITPSLPIVNSAGRAFIAASPFVVIATGSQRGLDCSPKGDQSGFVVVLNDGRTLLIPDGRGNNKIDGLKNLIADPRIGLIFFVPGANETYQKRPDN